ncbi:MAG: 50S ribosomal protein L20, partial [Candidatus Nealsonbacteria bacterium CG02_land_8_20_14_3_00_40_11]
INAACKQQGISYSSFIARLKKNKIELDRKILSDLARNHPQILEKIIEKTKS